MHFQVLTAISGALGLAALSVAAPVVSYGGPDSCALSAPTAFVTVPQPTTVTIHDAPTSTSYVTVGLSELPTTTLMRVNTLYSTTTTLAPQFDMVYISEKASSSADAATITSQSHFYKSTVFDTTVLTLTNVQLAPPSSCSTVTFSETAAPNRLLTFVVENGTTYWLNGQTPPTSQSYVIQTSVITVEPVNTPVTNQPQTSTLALHTTIYLTTPLTIIETLSALDSSSTRSQIYTASSFGTAPTDTHSSWPGWNTTSSAGGVLGSTTSNQITTVQPGTSPVYNQVSFITEESTLDIYGKHTSTFSLSSYAAQSGFNALTSECVTQTSQASSTSSAGGHLTTPVRSGQTSSSGGPAASTQANTTSVMLPSSLSTSTPHGNASTSARPASATSSAIGADTSCGEELARTSSRSIVTASSGVLSLTRSGLGITTSISLNKLCSTKVGNITVSALSASATSSAIGADTSCGEELTRTSSRSNATASSSLSASTGSALGELTSTASQAMSPTDIGNVTSFWTSKPITSLPILSTLTSSTSNVTVSSSIPTSASSALGGLTSTTSKTLTPTVSKLTSFSTSKPLTTIPTSDTSLLTSSVTPTTLSTLSSMSSSVSAASSISAGVGNSPISDQGSTTPSTIASQTTTSVSPMVSAISSLCGPCGDFTLNFDDISPLSVSNQSANTVDPEPIFSPYHKFDFSDGFVVVPPPTDPYVPSSPPLLLEFIPNFTLNTTNAQSGPNSAEFGFSGDIGNADHGASGCFSFNIYGASLGCDSRGPDCVFSFTGFRYDPTTGLTNSFISENQVIPACPPLNNCALVPITLNSAFQDLDSIRINVTVAGEPKIWWMDDLRLGWADNSCEKGLCRQNIRIHAINHL